MKFDTSRVLYSDRKRKQSLSPNKYIEMVELEPYKSYVASVEQSSENDDKSDATEDGSYSINL